MHSVANTSMHVSMCFYLTHSLSYQKSSPKPMFYTCQSVSNFKPLNYILTNLQYCVQNLKHPRFSTKSSQTSSAKRTENNRYRACKVWRKFHYLVKKIHQRWHKPCASTRFLDSHLQRTDTTGSRVQVLRWHSHTEESHMYMAVSQLWAISTYWPTWSYSGKEAKVLTFTLWINMPKYY